MTESTLYKDNNGIEINCGDTVDIKYSDTKGDIHEKKDILVLYIPNLCTFNIGMNLVENFKHKKMCELSGNFSSFHKAEIYIIKKKQQ